MEHEGLPLEKALSEVACIVFEVASWLDAVEAQGLPDVHTLADDAPQVQL